MSTVKKILVFAVILLVAVVAIGAVMKFTGTGDKILDGLNPEFRVTYGDNEYSGKDNSLILPESGQARFEVKNAEKYTVQVVPNTNFEYTVGSKAMSFGSETEYTAQFLTSDNLGNGYFIIDCEPLRYTVENVLTRLWGGAEIELPELNETYYFKLVITSAGGEAVSIAIAHGGPVTGVTLEPDNIIF